MLKNIVFSDLLPSFLAFSEVKVSSRSLLGDKALDPEVPLVPLVSDASAVSWSRLYLRNFLDILTEHCKRNYSILGGRKY